MPAEISKNYRALWPERKATIAKHLAPGGKVFVQTDIEFLAEEMFDLFRQNENFREKPITENPFPENTEREKAVEDKNLPVCRAEFARV